MCIQASKKDFPLKSDRYIIYSALVYLYIMDISEQMQTSLLSITCVMIVLYKHFSIFLSRLLDTFLAIIFPRGLSLFFVLLYLAQMN